jgi:hypothetical protein
MRGRLTSEIQTVAHLHLGRKISTAELRLMAYTQYVMMNEQRIDPRKCNQDDREVLSKWREEGHIDGGASGLAITREFWDAICAILWFGYVLGAATNLPPATQESVES